MLTAAGVVIGFALSLVAGQVAKGLLIGVTPTDPLQRSPRQNLIKSTAH